MLRVKPFLGEIEAFCFRAGVLEKCKERVATEYEFELIVNGARIGFFSCSPTLLEEFAVGHLLSTGHRVRDGYEFRASDGRVEIHGELVKLDYAGRNGSQAFRAKDILRAVQALGDLGVGFRETGALHGALCFDPEGRILGHVEDVSRHCAVDKCLGLLARNGVDLSRVGLAVTCRLTKSIVEKAVRVGVPLVASRAAPTLEGIKAAVDAGLTVVGFVRKDRFNVYAHPERLIW
ncbi:MAG: formate dehydrogenase accessory sulfurtransferase FdhD [Infirmifilum uzonense]|uniref:formate dehydrogenase accessory sulfurtransferase FdhD n=1 Tax=Infirmifilum uzonense TaxID=1550241 RepID=UPI003C731D8B